MKEKGIWLLQNMKPEQIEKVKEIAPDYHLIEDWDENYALDYPVEKIEIVYGWHKGKTKEAKLLETENSSLKWIQLASAGVDYMDLERLEKNGVLLTNGSGIHAIPIAETVFGMLLAYGRKIQQAILDQVEHVWGEDQTLMELNEKTIMVVGAGSVGVEIARLAKAFNMKTIGINRSGREVYYMDVVYKQPELAKHVNKADIVVNVLPLTSETEHFFNENIFSQMKDGTLFVNVGRGPSVNTDDLIAALEIGKIAFAGLDVFENEPLEKESPLWDRKDVLITPHNSGFAEHFRNRLFRIFEPNLEAFVARKQLPQNVVDYEKKY